MDPEQAAGRLDEVDHRTDIYGLGAIPFAIITGYAPHEKTQRAAVDSGAGARGPMGISPPKTVAGLGSTGDGHLGHDHHACHDGTAQ